MLIVMILRRVLVIRHALPVLGDVLPIWIYDSLLRLQLLIHVGLYVAGVCDVIIRRICLLHIVLWLNDFWLAEHLLLVHVGLIGLDCIRF